MLTVVFEDQARTCDEVLHGLRHEDLRGTRQASDACACRDSDAAVLAVYDLALPGVNAGSDLDAEVTDVIRDFQGAAYGARGTIERGIEPIAGYVVLDAAPPGEGATDKAVMCEHTSFHARSPIAA